MATVFSKIIEGEIPSHKVYEDEHHLAFLTIDPFSNGHTLVIPKKEYRYVWDMPDDEYRQLWLVSKKVAHRVQQVFSPERVGVLVDGAEVPHAHIHIIPVQKGTTSALIRSHEEISEPDHSKLSEIANKLYFEE